MLNVFANQPLFIFFKTGWYFVEISDFFYDQCFKNVQNCFEMIFLVTYLSCSCFWKSYDILHIHLKKPKSSWRLKPVLLFHMLGWCWKLYSVKVQTIFVSQSKFVEIHIALSSSLGKVGRGGGGPFYKEHTYNSDALTRSLLYVWP